MEKKKVYKTVVKVTVLTEEPLECSSLHTLADIVNECMENQYVHKFAWLADNKILTGKTAEKALKELE